MIARVTTGLFLALALSACSTAARTEAPSGSGGSVGVEEPAKAVCENDVDCALSLKCTSERRCECRDDSNCPSSQRCMGGTCRYR